jgi:hypothetical protein
MGEVSRRARLAREPAPQRIVGHQAIQRCGEFLDAARRHQQAIALVVDQLRDAAGASAHGDAAVEERFLQGKAEALVQRRHGEDRGGADFFQDLRVAQSSREMHLRAGAVTRDRCLDALDLRGHRRAAHDLELPVAMLRRDPAEGFGEDMLGFATADRPDAEHDFLALRLDWRRALFPQE